MTFKLKKIFLGNFITFFSIVIILVFNIALLFFPLTNVFGFEFSFVNAILISFLSGIILISYIKKLRYDTELKVRLIKNFVLIGIIILIIPLIISLTHSFLGLTCSLKDGFLFYLVLTIPSYIIGLTLGVIAYSINKKFPVIIYLLLFIIVLSIPLIEFYFNPQIYFFNPIFGLFPGTIYDEGLSVSLKLLSYRIINVLFFTTVLISLYKYQISAVDNFKKNIILSVSFITVTIFIFISPILGFSTTKQSLSNYLNKKVVTKHFEINFMGKINNRNIYKIVMYHEFYYSRLSKYFKVKLNKKIESFVFDDNSQKGKLFGSANADVAKPWLSQIYTTKDSYSKTLEHEIAHIFSASFGKTIFKIADGLNPSLIEGVAVAASPYYDDYNIDYMASLAFVNGFKINIINLFNGASFFGQASSLSYIYAGSFSKYLIDNYGVSKFKLFYKNTDFSKIYNSQLKDVTKKYYNYLKSFNTKGDSSKANYYFGRRTIFQKVCPRYVSDRLKDASREFANHNWIKSSKIYSEILGKTNNYYALIGYADVSKELDKTQKGLIEIENNLKDFINTPYYYNLQFKLADLYFLSKKKFKADSLYKKIINEKPNIWLEHLSSLRLILLNSPEQLNLYLKGSPTARLLLLLKLNHENNADIILPVAVRLAKILDIEYEIFIKNFLSDEIAANLKDRYTMNILSMYMLENFDFNKSKIMIKKAKSLSKGRFNDELIKYNLKKINWMSENYNSIIEQIENKH